MAKLAAAEAGVFCLDRAIQTHGGNAVSRAYQLATYWFLARLQLIQHHLPPQGREPPEIREGPRGWQPQGPLLSAPRVLGDAHAEGAEVPRRLGDSTVTQHVLQHPIHRVLG